MAFLCRLTLGTKRNLNNIFYCAINRAVVHLDDFVAFLAVGLFDRIFDGINSFIFGKNPGNQEESGLHNHVNAGAESKGKTKGDSINDIKFGFLVDQITLDFSGQFVPDGIFIIAGGQQEGATFIKIGEHINLLEKGEVMAGDEIGFVDQVRCNNFIFPETQDGWW